MSPGSTDRRHGIVRLLSASPHGLSDADLARALDAAVRPQTVNQLCRRMVVEGTVERVGNRPILNRLVPAERPRRGSRPATRTNGAATATSTTVEGATAPADTAPTSATAPADAAPTSATAPADAAAPDAADIPPEAADAPPEAADAPPEAAETPTDDRHAPPEAEAAVAPTNGTAHSSEIGVPAHDFTLAWSRTANVLAAVARWLTLHGGTIRSATPEAGGPARDLVAFLDGDEIHVEITGWPADGARTHPTTIAGDWFTAAEHAATDRRRTHPGARIVIALPDTRRYRSLSRHRAEALASARAEVWFVDPAGSVHPH